MTGKSFKILLSNGEEKNIHGVYVRKSEDGSLVFDGNTHTTHIFAPGNWEYVEEIKTEDKS